MSASSGTPAAGPADAKKKEEDQMLRDAALQKEQMTKNYNRHWIISCGVCCC